MPGPLALPPRPSLLGPYAALQRRAAAVGRSLAGMRAEDVGAALDVLAARADVDPARVRAVGLGGFAVPLLLAAARDARVSELELREAPASYRVFLEHPIHRGLPEILLPGVLRQHDLDDLVLAVLPRPVTLVRPAGALGQPLRRAERERAFARLRAEAARRGHAGRLHIGPRP